MEKVFPIKNEKKLAVLYRVEAGCLGPDGLDYIAGFCKFAQLQLQTLHSDYIALTIVHREDKTLPEMQYSLLGKILTNRQAEKYLSLFGSNVDDLECDLSDELTNLIHQFMCH